MIRFETSRVDLQFDLKILRYCNLLAYLPVQKIVTGAVEALLVRMQYSAELLTVTI